MRYVLISQVGALKDIKRDMALRRNSLHKLLVHELENRVFVSVSNPKGVSGTSDDPDGEEDETSMSSSLMRSENANSPSWPWPLDFQAKVMCKTPRALFMST